MDDRNPRERKVKVVDKRRAGHPSAGDAPSHSGLQSVFESPSREASPPASNESPAEESPSKAENQSQVGEVESVPLEDLRRLQADFDNYRKRMIREQTQMAARASARLIEKLLPVLDNFERAISHGEGGAGVELVYKELRRTLEQEGLEEIEAEGEPFDPTIHHAISAIEDPEVSEPIVREVHQRGYRLKDQVLRYAMVVVAQPAEAKAESEAVEDEEKE
jgi:molecular chaperone GrpE